MVRRVFKMVSAAALSGGAVAALFLIVCVATGHDAMEAIFGTWLLVVVPMLAAAIAWWKPDAFAAEIAEGNVPPSQDRR